MPADPSRRRPPGLPALAAAVPSPALAAAMPSSALASLPVDGGRFAAIAGARAGARGAHRPRPAGRPDGTGRPGLPTGGPR